MVSNRISLIAGLHIQRRQLALLDKLQFIMSL